MTERLAFAEFLHLTTKAATAGLPLAATAKWHHGVFDREFLRKGGVSLSVFAPRIEDLQTAHDEDELYFIASGRGTLEVGEEAVVFAPGDVIYVPAGMPHRFVGDLKNLVTWVVFLPA